MIATSVHGSRQNWAWRSASTLFGDLRRRWYLYVFLVAAWVPLLFRFSGDRVPVVPLVFNITGSLPYTVAIVIRNPGPIRRGDFVVFSFEGDTRSVKAPGLAHEPFFKRVAGLPGDLVEVHDRDVFVAGEHLGRAKARTKAGVALEPIHSMVIPAGSYYVQGTMPDSFDSRYTAVGLVLHENIAYKVRPLF